MRVLVALALIFGCSERAERTPLVVFAASSLTEAMGELERAYEAAHPEMDVQPTHAGSQVLRLQIAQGAPADLFASADPEHMAALAEAGHVGPAETLAEGELALIVPAEASTERFEELDQARRIVVGAPTVPVGRYTRQLLERAESTHGQAFVAAVRGAIVSEETNVRLVRAKVTLGEADAAFVYRSDATAEGIRSVPIPPELNVRARYPIAVTTRAAHPAEAARFVAWVRSAEGRALLERHGFRAEAP